MSLIKDLEKGKKTPFLAFNIKTFKWSPNSNEIIYGCYSKAKNNITERKHEMANRIIIVSIFTRRMRAWKSINQLDVTNIDINYSNDGKFVIALIKKLKK